MSWKIWVFGLEKKIILFVYTSFVKVLSMTGKKKGFVFVVVSKKIVYLKLGGVKTALFGDSVV